MSHKVSRRKRSDIVTIEGVKTTRGETVDVIHALRRKSAEFRRMWSLTGETQTLSMSEAFERRAKTLEAALLKGE